MQIQYTKILNPEFELGRNFGLLFVFFFSAKLGLKKHIFDADVDKPITGLELNTGQASREACFQTLRIC